MLELKDKLDMHLNIAGHKGDAFDEVKKYISEKGLNAYISILGEMLSFLFTTFTI